MACAAFCCTDSATEIQMPLVGSLRSSSSNSDYADDSPGTTSDSVEIFGKVRPSVSGTSEGTAFVARLSVKFKEEGVGAVFSDYEGRALRVKDIEVGGPMFWHNQRAPDSEKILVGSVITDVSGTSGSPHALRKALECSGVVDLAVRLPPSFEVQGLSKDGKPLGLCLARHSRAPALVVKGVQEAGVVAEWNSEFAATGADIREGDQIISVNGTAGDVEAMRELLSSSQELDLVIKRPLVQ